MARRGRPLEPLRRKTKMKLTRNGKPNGPGKVKKNIGTGSQYGPWAPGYYKS